MQLGWGTSSRGDAPDGRTAEFEIGFRPPRFWSPFMLAMVVGAVGGLAFALAFIGGDGSGALPVVAAFVAAAIALVGVVCGLRRLTMARTAPVLRVYADRLVLPRSASSRRYARVDMADVLSVDLYGRGKRCRLVVNTRRAAFVYPLAAIRSSLEDVARLRERVREALARRPDGAALLAQMDRRESLGRAALQIQPVATYALLAAIAVGFAWEHATGALDRPLGLLALGANASTLVADGQWFRLLAANFLHVNWLHIYFNALALYVLGALLERLIGPWRLLAIFLAGALGGSVLSALLAPALMSVGASTAVFGLLGALAWVNWQHRERLPAGFFQPVKWWVFIIGLNALLPILVPQIDYAAHVGGFAAGGLVAVLLCRSADAIRPGRPAPAGVRYAAVALVGVFAWGQVEAVRYSLQPAGSAEAQLVRALVRDEAAPPDLLNEFAWDYVTRYGATEAELELALMAARRAVELDPVNGPYLDTLATAYYRLGRYDLAVATERRAAAVYDPPFVYAQLGRFLAARMSESGPMQLGGASVSDVELTAAPDGGGIVVAVDAAVPRGLVVFALAVRGGRIVGVFEAVVGAHREPGRFEWRAAEGPFAAGGARPPDLDVALVDATGCACAPRSFQARFVPMDRRAAQLP